MQKIGILGGLGPETTANFYLYIIAECQRIHNQHRPDLMISNVPINYQLEEDSLLHGKNVGKLCPLLIEQAQRLEQAGADYIVMPCNTLHQFEDDIKTAIHIPFISIVDVVHKFVKNLNTTEVGLIATGLTLEAGFYQQALSSCGVKLQTPDGFQQAKISKMIYGLVTGQYTNNQRQTLIDIIETFHTKGIEHTLLACTDLQALIPHHPTVKITDTMQLLADEVVRTIHSKH